MGLDITAWEFIKELPPHERSDDCYEGDPPHVSLYAGDFPISEKGLEVGRCYAVSGEALGWRAGSYSGYGEWRNWLSETMLGVEAPVVWNDEAWQDAPFYELIHYSDCEGLIGPEVCAKLAADFDNNRDKLPERSLPWLWYLDLYEQWSQGFHLAANHGCVVFH